MPSPTAVIAERAVSMAMADALVGRFGDFNYQQAREVALTAALLALQWKAEDAAEEAQSALNGDALGGERLNAEYRTEEHNAAAADTSGR